MRDSTEFIASLIDYSPARGAQTGASRLLALFPPNRFFLGLAADYLPLSIVAVVILQLLFTYAKPFQAMFGNEAIPLRIWPWLLAGGLVFFLVVETEKFVIRSSDSLRRAVTAVEAGA